MAAKAVLVVCAQFLLVQRISCFYAPYGPGSAFGTPVGLYDSPYAPGLYESACAPYSAVASTAASHGGAMPVASSSPLPPNGVSVLSENRFNGPLAVSGQLPFLGTVALEGALPTLGSGAVNYGAGNGNVAMTREEIAYGSRMCGSW